jgi:hypothetical protein
MLPASFQGAPPGGREGPWIPGVSTAAASSFSFLTMLLQLVTAIAAHRKVNRRWWCILFKVAGFVKGKEIEARSKDGEVTASFCKFKKVLKKCNFS